MSKSQAEIKRVIADLYQFTRDLQDNIFSGDMKVNVTETGYVLELENFESIIKIKGVKKWTKKTKSWTVSRN